MSKLLLALLLLGVSVSADAHNVRKTSVKNAFMRLHPCPSGPNKGATHLPCKGWVIDDIKPLDCGGKDEVANKQWQTEAAAKRKDKWERNGPECKHRTHG